MTKLTHKFVTSVPDELIDGVIYVSIEYATVIHKCCCGCGNEVVTPLSQTDWRLIFDGQTISLYPSIGNWSFKCQSHYWIRNNAVEWAPKWSKEKIAEVRDGEEAGEQRDKEKLNKRTWFDIFFGGRSNSNEATRVNPMPKPEL